MPLEWTSGTIELRCPVCAHSEGQELLARFDVTWRDEAVEIARCRACRAIVLGAMLPPSMYTDADWDWYVEQIGGVEAIADTLVQTGMRNGVRMLDVGCGYGFALDVARHLFEWEGVGLDPSIAAARGKRDLALDIRPGTLDDAFEPDERFDVIFSSEVIEHIPDPRQFLDAVHRRLAPGGVLVLTTPDAASVEPDTPWTVLYAVLSVGLHEFLVDASGLERLLGEAGFHAKVWNVGFSLRAVASLTAEPLEAVMPDARVSVDDLADYAEMRCDAAEPGSSLALGMAMRQLKWMAGDNNFARANAHLPALRRALLDRYALDLDDPHAIVGQPAVPASLTTTGRPAVPAVLTIIFYNLGLVRLFHDHDTRRAAECFEAAAWAGRAQWDLYGLYQDPETPAFEAMARGQLVLALARMEPTRVDAVLAELDEGVARGAGDADIAAMFRARLKEEQALRRSPLRRAYRRLRSFAGRVRRRARRAIRDRPWSGRRA
jgi:2-polyprenyl-3-methyl-5-hydroxy-6-metoxy-1,4-benzoquinol methylase